VDTTFKASEEMKANICKLLDISGE